MIINIPTSNSINGDRLAENVYDAYGNIILEKDTVLNCKLKRQLVDLGIISINIYNPLTNFDDYEKVHKTIIQEVESTLTCISYKNDHIYDEITEYFSKMCESISDNPIIIKSLDRIRKLDNYTFKHSINTSLYSMLIAIWMNQSNKEIINATQAGILHDIGKIYIPYEILNKETKLTEEEYEEIKKHTLYGYFLLNNFSEFNQEVKKAVLFHHERIDSLGYPLGAKPDSVGITSKIVAVADVYDAMTTDRVYKMSISSSEAVNYLSTDGMKILDNNIIKVFKKNILKYDFKSTI